MDLIANNPFRVLGLPVTASEREITRRISDLSIFAEMGKVQPYETDFTTLGPVLRTPEAVKSAAKSIEQPESKLYYSLFWFWNKSSADELAFELLADGYTEKAKAVWAKIVEGDGVSQKNFSVYKNLGVLCLATGLNKENFRKDDFLNGLRLIGEVLTSPHLEEYFRVVVDDNYTVDKEKLLRTFADEVLQGVRPLLEKDTVLSSKEIVSCFQGFPFEALQYIQDRFVIKPLQQIDEQIDAARQARLEKPGAACQTGEQLYRALQEDLSFVKQVLDASDLKFQMIADKAANEILQCAIDYFNATVETGADARPSERVLRLIGLAGGVAVGKRVKDRIENNSEAIRNWESKQSAQVVKSTVGKEAEKIMDALRSLPFINGLSYYERVRLPGLAVKLLDACKPELEQIRNKLGPTDRYYLELCSAVANNVLGMCVIYVNTTDDPQGVLGIMNTLDDFDLDPAMRKRFEENNKILRRVMERRGISIS